tara:strand:- start:390 stop:563 length:174 start_codon:yes stop_codon:yes gene_type:complete
VVQTTQNEVCMNKYLVKSMLSGAVVLIVAKTDIQAMKRGRRYFSEPNRPFTPVRLLS